MWTWISIDSAGSSYGSFRICCSTGSASGNQHMAFVRRKHQAIQRRRPCLGQGLAQGGTGNRRRGLPLHNMQDAALGVQAPAATLRP